MSHHNARTWIAAGVLGLLPTIAVADTFMQVPGTPGDSSDGAHPGWIRVASVDWSTTAETSWTKGGGASVGKPNPAAIKLTLTSGPWSTVFLRAIASGRVLDTTGPIVLEHVLDGHPVYRLTLQGFFLTKYEVQSDAQKLPLDTVEAVFKSVAMDQFQIDASGRLQGSAGVMWDIPAGTVNAPSAPAAPPAGIVQPTAPTLKRSN